MDNLSMEFYRVKQKQKNVRYRGRVLQSRSSSKPSSKRPKTDRILYLLDYFYCLLTTVYQSPITNH